jgi:uncharacterized protein
MGWSPADQSVWLFLETSWEGTQRGMLEMLFGAGLMVTAAKAMEHDGPAGVADLYIRRNLWLLLFGQIDIFALLWLCDILLIYALSALALFPFRKLSVRWLLILGLTFATLTSAIGGIEYLSRIELQKTHTIAVEKQQHGQKLNKEEAEAIKTWDEKIARATGQDPVVQKLAKEEVQARAGSFGDYAEFLTSTYLLIVGKGSLIGGVIEAFSVMLIGIALWKLGFIQGLRSTRDYVVVLVLAYAFGLTARYVGGLERMAFQPIPKTLWLTPEYARIAVSLGHVALLNLLMRFAPGRAVMKPFIAAGQMAFSLYFLEQVIGIYVMYSPIGLHLPGAQGWAYTSALAGVIVVGLLVFANLWMRLFASGPLEWVWRSLSYWHRQPFRRRAET